MSEKTNNKSDLNYWIFNNDYPLHNCALGIICGSTNSGKSHFTYKCILPAYVKSNAVKTIQYAAEQANTIKPHQMS